MRFIAGVVAAVGEWPRRDAYRVGTIYGIVKTTVYLDDRDAATLRQIAAESGRSQAEIIREAMLLRHGSHGTAEVLPARPDIIGTRALDASPDGRYIEYYVHQDGTPQPLFRRDALNCTLQGRAADIGGDPVLLGLAQASRPTRSARRLRSRITRPGPPPPPSACGLRTERFRPFLGEESSANRTQVVRQASDRIVRT